MMRLKSKLLSLNAEKAHRTKIFSPANTEELRIPFKVDKTAKVVGKLAQIPPPNTLDQEDGQLITGVLVQNDFKMSLMAPEDLREYAGLTTTTIMCKQKITLSAAGVELIKWALEGTFGAIEEMGAKKKTAMNGAKEMNGNGVEHDEDMAEEEIDHPPQPVAYLVMGCVIVRYQSGGAVEVEWEGNILNDGIADAVMAVLFTVESSPAAVKRKRPFLRCSGSMADCLLRILQTASPQARAQQAESARLSQPRRALLTPLHVPRSAIRPICDSDQAPETGAQASKGVGGREWHQSRSQ